MYEKGKHYCATLPIQDQVTEKSGDADNCIADDYRAPEMGNYVECGLCIRNQLISGSSAQYWESRTASPHY